MKALGAPGFLLTCILGAHVFGACSSDTLVGDDTAGSGGTTAGAGGTLADSGPDATVEDAADGDADALGALIEHWVNGLCAALPACCVQDQLTGDEAHCRESLHSLIDAYGFPANVDTATLATCAEEAIALAQKCDPAFERPPSCNPSGQRLPGSACSAHAECAEPAVGKAECGYTSVSPNEKACVQFVPGKAGDPCDWTCVNSDFTNCFSGSFEEGYIQVTCLVSDGLTCQGTCTPFQSLGEPCQSFSCGPAAFCNLQAVCETKRPLGATCPEFPHGSEESCADGLYCEGAQNGVAHSGTCAAMSTLGGPCSEHDQCPGKNCHQGVCHEAWKFGPTYCK